MLLCICGETCPRPAKLSQGHPPRESSTSEDSPTRTPLRRAAGSVVRFAGPLLLEHLVSRCLLAKGLATKHEDLGCPTAWHTTEILRPAMLDMVGLDDQTTNANRTDSLACTVDRYPWYRLNLCPGPEKLIILTHLPTRSALP